MLKETDRSVHDGKNLLYKTKAQRLQTETKL